MRAVLFIIIATIGLSSCRVYQNYSSPQFSIEELNFGIGLSSIIGKYGEPYSFSKEIVGKDTVVILSYISPKPVANCELIVATQLIFTNSKLNKISQSEFLIPENIQICDSSKVGYERLLQR